VAAEAAHRRRAIHPSATADPVAARVIRHRARRPIVDGEDQVAAHGVLGGSGRDVAQTGDGDERSVGEGQDGLGAA